MRNWRRLLICSARRSAGGGGSLLACAAGLLVFCAPCTAATLTVAHVGKLSPAGFSALVHGTLTCSPGSSVFVSGSITQGDSQGANNGNDIACNGSTQPWAVPLGIQNDRLGSLAGPLLHPGEASVSVEVDDSDTAAALATADQRVVLPGRRSTVSFNPPPPPDAPTFTLEPVGKVSRDGAVTLRGTITCHNQVPPGPGGEQDNVWFLDANLAQGARRAFGGPGPRRCTTHRQAWTATLRSDSGAAFHPGPLAVLISAGHRFVGGGTTSVFLETVVRLQSASP